MWWEGGVMLSHHHDNMEHSINQCTILCLPMNNTFSLHPQVSDTVCFSIILVLVSF